MARLSSQLLTWEVSFSLKPGGSESHRLPSGRMARAGLGADVLRFYFLGCYASMMCWGKSRKQKLITDTLTFLEKYVSKPAHLYQAQTHH